MKIPMSAIIYLTNQCNMNCKHCFVKGQDNTFIDTNRLKQVINDLAVNKIFFIGYTGGDPVLHNDVIEIIDYTYEMGILPLLGISGTGLNNSMISKLSSTKLGSIQVSLDGSTEDVNSLLRDENSFNEIINNIKIFQKEKMQITVAVCIHEGNKNDLYNILNLLKSLEIFSVKIQFVFNSKSKKIIELCQNDKVSVYNLCIEFQKENDMDEWIKIDFAVNSNNNIEKLHSNGLIIEANGNIKLGGIDRILGNIKNELPSEILSKYERN